MAIKPKNPIFGNWWKGIGFSKYDTAFFDALTNADIISEVGSLKCNFGLKKDSGTTITEQCLQVVCPSGIIYFFSQSSGSIWKRSTVGTYSSVTANANGAHAGCGFYNGYVYYADNTTKLGRFNPDTEGNRNDSWKSFTNSGFPRPMKVQNNILHIGDYNNVFTVNASDSIFKTE